MGFSSSSVVKNMPANSGYRVQVPTPQVMLVVKNPANKGEVRDAGLVSGWGKSWEEIATFSSIFAWKIHEYRSLVGYGLQNRKSPAMIEVT